VKDDKKKKHTSGPRHVSVVDVSWAFLFQVAGSGDVAWRYGEYCWGSSPSPSVVVVVVEIVVSSILIEMSK
jgi:hypothetical protein